MPAPKDRGPVRHPVFAFFYDLLAASTEEWEGRYREEVCGAASGRVLELGAGTGMNFRHYREARQVVAAEPEPNMLRRAAGRAREAMAPVDLVRSSGESLPFPDASFDTVTCTLVLCSVSDPSLVLGEARRVLKPGGELRFYEHVRSPEPRMATWQDRLERPWGFFAGGCHPNRQTLSTLSSLGFSGRYRMFDPPMAGGRFLPHVVGTARAPG